MTRAYTHYACPLCGRRISTAGVAKVGHMRKHVREGKLREIRTEWGIRFEYVRQEPNND